MSVGPEDPDEDDRASDRSAGYEAGARAEQDDWDDPSWGAAYGDSW